jgi:circadian clock protein KaiB
MHSDGVPIKATDGAMEPANYVLRLYVTGATSRSSRAISNARRIFDKHLDPGYDLQIVDIYQEPLKAKEHQIVAAPTLVRVSPGPTRRVIGDLSDEMKLLKAFGLAIPLAGSEAT